MKKGFLLSIIFCLSVVSIFAQQVLKMKPVNPEFIEYFNKKSNGELVRTTEDGNYLGEVPSPLVKNFDNLQVSTPKSIPAAYDLRTVENGLYLTSVKNQGQEGACWAFATYAAIESYWKKQGLATFDLSEQNLATCHGFDWLPSDGGNYDLSTAYLSRMSGPISEVDDIYTLPDNPSCVSGFTPVAYVAEARFLPGIYDTGYTADIIKQSIIDNGVLYCNMCFDNDYMSYSNETYFYNGSEGTNHGVAIVGWDDAKDVTGGSLATPSSTGAWIIKNSWGPSWGESGYFYVSYEDTKALSSIAYFPSHVDYNSSSEVYYYDDLGATSAWGSGDGDDYGLVKYTASENQQITMLGSYVVDAGTDITFDVYNTFDGTTLSGQIGSTGVQTCIYPGYYTFELSTPINISSGSDFYIKVRYNTGGDYTVPVESAFADYSSGVIVETGKFWLSNNGGSWTEIGESTSYDYDLCIKAYAVDVATAPPVANFTSDVTIATVGQTVYFTDASTGIPDDWDWTFDGGIQSTSTSTNPTVTYSTPGTYDVTLSVSNAQGSDEITISDYITVTSAPTSCEYHSNIDDVADNVVWYTSTGGYLTGINDNNFTQFAEYYDSHINNSLVGVSFGVAKAEDLSVGGIITVKVWDVSGGNPGTVLYSEDIDIADFTPSSWNDITFDIPTIVPNEFFIGYEIYTTSPQDTFAIYQAEGRDAASLLPSTAYIYYSGYWGNTDDIYTGGFNTSFSISPYICPAPPTAEFSADVTSACDNLTVQFTDESSANTDSWYWDFGDLQTSTEQSPEHNYSSSGTYTVTLTSTNSIGFDVMEKIDYIIIGETPSDVIVTGGGTQCGGTLTLTATGGDGGTIYWQNTTSDGTSTTTAATSQDVSESGTYYFRAQSAEGCWGVEGSETVTINEVPTDVIVTGGGTQCGGTMTLTATGGDGGTIYWQNTTSDGTSTTTAATSQDVSESGTYYFRAQSAEGCWGVEGSETVTINEVPTDVTVTGGGTQCGGTMTLTATGGDGGTIYWQNTTSDGTSTITAATSQDVSESGTYYFRAQSAEGCWGVEGSETVTINEVPTDVIVTGGGTQCGGTMTLTATGGDGGTIYWQNTTSDGTSTTTAATSQDVSESGTYYFRAQSAEGCWGVEGSETVTINEVPTDVTVTGGGTQCGGTMTLTATGGDGGTIYWQNTTSDGTSTTIAATSQDVSESGTYYFRAQSAEGCWGNEGSSDVIIHPALEISMSSTNESAPEANDGTVTVTVLSGTPDYVYNWASPISEETSSSITGLSGGNYCLTVTDDNLCEASDCVTINTNGALPVVNFTADHTSGCDSLTVIFTDVSTNNPVEWAWNFGDGETSDEQNPSHIYLTPETYSVTLEATNSTGANTITITDYIVIGETPIIDYIMSPASGALVADGGIEVIVTGGAEPYNIIWGHDAMETSLNLLDLLPGDYHITVTEDAGCEANEHIVVEWVNYVEEIAKGLDIYPNPTDVQLNIFSEGESIKNVTIVNVLGEVVYQNNENTNQLTLDVEDFSVGTYFITIDFAENSIVRKFIKQ